MALRKNAPGSGVRARVRCSTSVACAWKLGATCELRVTNLVVRFFVVRDTSWQKLRRRSTFLRLFGLRVVTRSPYILVILYSCAPY